MSSSGRMPPATTSTSSTCCALKSSMTRGRHSLEYRRLHIVAEGRAEDIYDLAQRGIGFDCLDDRRHRVFSTLSYAAQVVQRALYRVLVALFAHALQAFQVRHLAHTVDVEGWNLDLLFHQIVVDAHDGALVSINLLLIAISRLGDLALKEAVLDTGQHTAQRIDAVDIVH